MTYKNIIRIFFIAIVIVLVYIFYHLLEQYYDPFNQNVYVEEKEYDDELTKKCFYRAFSDSILVLNFNFPFYNNVDTLKDLYEGVFARVVACGPAPTVFLDNKQPDIVFDVEQGHFSYHCLALAMEKFPNYKGYFYGQDDMIINWWTFTENDRDKIWHGTKVIDWRQDAYGKILKPDWIWWKSYMGIEACQKYYTTLKSLAASSKKNFVGFDGKKALDLYLKNGGNKPRCAKGWSDFFFIPGHFAQHYRNLSHIAYNNKLYLEIAVHNILRSIVGIDDFLLVDGVYMPDKGLQGFTTDAFWKLYNHQIAFIHPYKFNTDERYFSGSRLKHDVIRFKQKLTDCFQDT